MIYSNWIWSERSEKNEEVWIKFI